MRRFERFTPVELKALDTSVAETVNTSGGVKLLNGIVPGVGFNQRIGRQVRMASLSCILQYNAKNLSSVDQFHRYLIVRDKQANGGALAVSDVLTSVSVSAPLNLSQQHRFVILYDELVHLNPFAEPGSSVPFQRQFRVDSLVQYNAGTTGTVTDIVTNSLYFICIGSATPGNDDGTATGTIRLRFTDE